MGLNTATLDMPQELVAELRALEALAARHRREYVRLRAIEMAKLTGEPVKFTRDRMTQKELAELPPVLDANGVELAPGMKVRTPDGVRAEIVRVDKRSKRCVVDRADGQRKMTVARRLTALNVRRRPPAPQSNAA
jgi:hypothetical protein